MKRVICVLMCMGLLTACGKAEVASDESSADVVEVESTSSDETSSEMSPEELFKAFCAGTIKAEVKIADSDGESMDASYFQFEGTAEDEIDPNLYVTVADPVDLDNDGEVEFILENEIYGYTCFDCKDGKVVCFARGEGTTAVCDYTKYKDAYWIVHSDTSHEGRCTYELTKYDGNLDIVDSFNFGWEDWEDDGNKKYYKNDQDITKEEYEALEAEVLE
ncbi:MAG: hypothetical protein K6G01_04005 [Eubacterium sp.]|nr:hypothetical protein [Eubacterium sp.]